MVTASTTTNNTLPVRLVFAEVCYINISVLCDPRDRFPMNIFWWQVLPTVSTEVGEYASIICSDDPIKDD